MSRSWPSTSSARRHPTRREIERRSPPTRRELARDLPAVREVIVGNEPNLNLLLGAAVRRRRKRRRRRLVRGAARRRPTTRSRPSPAARSDRRRARAARWRRLERVTTDALTDRVHSRPGRGVQGERPKAPADGLVLDPRLRREPRIPPAFAHPKTTSIGIADYDELVALLGTAFDGTAQAGSDLPIVYGEYGVETNVPPDKAKLYTGGRSCRLSHLRRRRRSTARRSNWPGASRRAHALLLPRRRRDAPRRSAERCAVRRRNGEAEPRGRSHHTTRSLDFAA